LPCGFDLVAACADADRYRASLCAVAPRAIRSACAYAVDATAHFSRPGPRVADGVELLAALLHPDIFPGASLEAERLCGRRSYIVTLWRPLPDETTCLPGVHTCDRLQRRAREDQLGGQVIGVINASDLSLVSATDFSVTTRSWPGTTAGPSAIAGGGRTFVVTLEQANAVGVSLLVTCPPDPVAL